MKYIHCLFLIIVSNIFINISLAQQETRIDEDLVLGKVFLADKQYDSAYHYLQMAAEHGSVEGMYEVATLYANGHGTPLDKNKAKYYYTKAAQNGYDKANVDLAILIKDMGMEKEAITLLEHALKLDTRAYAILAKIQLNHDDVKSALKLLHDGAKVGDSEALYLLGQMYYEGDELEQDEIKGIKLIRLAAQKKHEGAIKYLEDEDIPLVEPKKNAADSKKKKKDQYEDEDNDE